MVTLDPSCVQPGRLTVTVSGDIECFDLVLMEFFKIFSWKGPSHFTHLPAGSVMGSEVRKHTIFLRINVLPAVFFLRRRVSFYLQRVFASSLRRRPSVSSLNIPTSSIVERTYPFSFELPRSCPNGEEIPPTFYSSKHAGPSAPASRAGSFSVEYKILVAWDPTAAYEYPSL